MAAVPYARIGRFIGTFDALRTATPTLCAATRKADDVDARPHHRRTAVDHTIGSAQAGLRQADIYRSNLSSYQANPTPRNKERHDGQSDRLATSGAYLMEHLQDAPVLLIPCLQGRVENSAPGLNATFWASVMPAAWSFCLALRSRGLGTCWTTLHLLGDGERAAAEVLGIPYTEFSQAGLFPIAYTKGTDFRPARRMAPELVTRWDSW